ncbi:hypothetical protein M1N13_04155 [Dehalococcoidia bacterium]|nr:hypothetical protein [Dehalococcoidia bacterium]
MLAYSTFMALYLGPQYVDADGKTFRHSHERQGFIRQTFFVAVRPVQVCCARVQDAANRNDPPGFLYAAIGYSISDLDQRKQAFMLPPLRLILLRL